YCFFFQAEDGIRDRNVTGVQTCALPIFHGTVSRTRALLIVQPNTEMWRVLRLMGGARGRVPLAYPRPPRFRASARHTDVPRVFRSEERRVGKECRCRWWGWDEKKKELRC